MRLTQFLWQSLLNLYAHKGNGGLHRIMCSSWICFLNQYSIANVWLHFTHTQVYSFSWGTSSCDFLNFIIIIYVTFFLLNVLCHLVAHQHLTWAHSSTSMTFHNSLSYYGMVFSAFFLNISLFSISFFMISSSFSTTMLSLYFSTAYFEVYSWQGYLHASYLRLSISF